MPRRALPAENASRKSLHSGDLSTDRDSDAQPDDAASTIEA
jgi:hypothetical protein